MAARQFLFLAVTVPIGSGKLGLAFFKGLTSGIPKRPKIKSSTKIGELYLWKKPTG
jgi:hypothetical protein